MKAADEVGVGNSPELMADFVAKLAARGTLPVKEH